MVKDKKHLYHIIDTVVESPKSRAILKDAVDDYSSALLRQTDVSGSLPLDRIKGMFKYDDCSMPISEDDKLRKYGVAEYNKAISDVLDVLRQ